MIRRLQLLLACLILSVTTHATWSIVAIDMRTGEVAVYSTTCITNDVIERHVPVLMVGKGAAAVQYLRDPGAFRRIYIRNGLVAGWTPQAIHQGLAQTFSGQGLRQYGIVSVDGPPWTHTGGGVDDAHQGAVGIVGDYAYAIQGNSLAGVAVIDAGEAAFLNTNGDLGQRVMAAMEAARALGGDGRCSCASYDPFCQDLALCGPDVCGTPPPSFTKASHVAHVALARLGDSDGGCDQQIGCTAGDYYFEAVYYGGDLDPDPVLQLELQFQAWRAGLQGRPDHHLSTVALEATSIPADGATTRSVEVELVDVNGVPLGVGGATLVVTAESGLVSTSAPIDHGNGRYSFDVMAGSSVGTERLVIVADDGVRPVTLAPLPVLELAPVAPLHIGLGTVSSSAPRTVPFVLNEPSVPGAAFVLFASASGTAPGLALGGTLLPLNPDQVFLCSVLDAGGPLLPDSAGVLDLQGRAEAHFVPTPGLLDGLIGARLDWAAVVVGSGSGATNPVGLLVEP